MELAERDERIVLLTADLGYLLMEPFAQRFPDRFLNVGVAEQNMVGIATGLAEAGMIPYVYSITPFVVLRPYEFIRNGPVYHQLKVRIVGSGGGFDYSHDGMSHFSLEDVGVLRVLPGLSLFVPADHQQAHRMFTQTWDVPGPIYYRLGKDEETLIPGLEGRFEVGGSQVLGHGQDVLFIALGPAAAEASAAMVTLGEKGIGCSLMVVASVCPPPVSMLGSVLPGFRHVITVEAHYVNGGLGSLVSEFVAERGIACTVVRCGVTELPDGATGSLGHLYDRFGISRDCLVQTAVKCVDGDLAAPRPGGNS